MNTFLLPKRTLEPVINQGIRAKDQSMVTYKQLKNALTYYYPKRKVLEDGRLTVPVDI